MDTDYIVVAALVALAGAGVYYRVRRTLGRQAYAPRAMRARMIFLCAAGAILVATLPTLAGIGASIAGGVLGSALAAFGVRHTRFERTDAGLFFTPNRWIGLGVTALFLGRLLYRVVFAYQLAQESLLSGDPPLQGLHRSPLTLSFYFLFAGYYVAYYAFVMRHSEHDASRS